MRPNATGPTHSTQGGTAAAKRRAATRSDSRAACRPRRRGGGAEGKNGLADKRRHRTLRLHHRRPDPLRARQAARERRLARGDGIVANNRRTQPIGTPEQIIECIERVQWAISMGKVILHFFYGGMPPDKAERSLRLFAERVLPAVHDMATPVNPATAG